MMMVLPLALMFFKTSSTSAPVSYTHLDVYKRQVVAYNCETGPSEIINHLQNGLLVENQNKEAMIAAINTFSEDKNLYLHCKKAVSYTHLDVYKRQICALLNCFM